MSKLPLDTIAFRRKITVTLVAFVVGFFVMLAALAWLITRFVTPEARWWDVLHASVSAILISFVLGGLGFAALASWLVGVPSSRNDNDAERLRVERTGTGPL
jgi:hypothetical protein